MATIKQQTAITKTIENLRNNNPKSMGKIMLESGYKPSVAKHPQVLTNSQAFQEAIGGINYKRHIKELDQLASIKKNSDKDNVLKAKDMLFKIGDKYPTQKTNVVGLFGNLDSLKETGKE